jgi:hypothetical protein
MALDARKRQKKLERKRAKQRAKKKTLVRHDPGDISVQLERAGSAPVLHAMVASSLWEQGMGNVLLSRELPLRQVAFGAFLVDMYCLGVKDAFYGVMAHSEYQERLLDGMFRRFDTTNLEPEAARKLVEGAVAYARDLGFTPHADYQRAKLIFGDIDAGESDAEFDFGKDGKPHFIAGPNDGPQRCRQIIGTLEERCGEDGYRFIMPHFV